MDAVSEIHLVYAVEVKAIAHSAAEPGLSFELNIELHLARMACSHVDCCLLYAFPPVQVADSFSYNTAEVQRCRDLRDAVVQCNSDARYALDTLVEEVVCQH